MYPDNICHLCIEQGNAATKQIIYSDRGKLGQHLSTEHLPGELAGYIMRTWDAAKILSAMVGPQECPEGFVKDEKGYCVPDSSTPVSHD